jgi:uncharacterized coiled-coil DUF342 family protein
MEKPDEKIHKQDANWVREYNSPTIDKVLKSIKPKDQLLTTVKMLKEALEEADKTIKNLESERDKLKRELEDSQKVITGLREENSIIEAERVQGNLDSFEGYKQMQSEIDSLKEQLNNLHKSISRI